jgi:thiol:disulfide interchange protein DsbD
VKQLATVRNLLYFVLLLAFNSAFANSYLPIWEAFKLKFAYYDQHHVAAIFNIADEYHIYQDKISITADADSSVKLGQALLPDSEIMHSPSLGDFKVYANQVQILLPITKWGDGKLKVNASYQGCKGLDLCFPAQASTQTIDLNGGIGTTSVSIATKPIENKPTVTPIVESNFWQNLREVSSNSSSSSLANYFAQNKSFVIAGFFILGLLIAFTPCVFPLFPILIAVISGANISTKRSFALATSYVIGGALTYAGAGMLAASVGYSLSAFLQSAWLAVIIAIAFTFFALSLFGVYNFQLPLNFQNKLNQIINRKAGGSLLGAMLIGGISNLVLSPCVTAPLAGALVYISTTGNIWLGGSALFALGIGSGVPLMLIAVAGKHVLPKNGNWMLLVKYALGHLMLAMAIYISSKFLSHDIILGLSSSWLAFIFWQIISALFSKKYSHLLALENVKTSVKVIIIGLGILVTLTNSAPPNASQFKVIVSNTEQLKQAIVKAKTEGKPILIDYYAKWCVACMEMDLQTLNDPKVMALMSNYSLIRADVTANNQEITELETYFKIIAPPTMVFLDTKGDELNDKRVIGFIDKQLLASKLENILGFSSKP